jgi:PKD repeat protein
VVEIVGEEEMKHRLLLIFLLSLLVVPCLAYGQATINVESVSAIPGGTATIDVTVSAVPAPGVTDIQGTFTFNPNVVHITDIVGLNGFSGFFFKNIDNVSGTAVVTAAIVGGAGITAGDMLRLTVQAVGAAGDSCAVGLAMAVFRDTNGNDIPHTVTPGTFTISATTNNPPTADFTYTPANPTINQTVIFIDASTDTDGVIVAWDWTFGDGGTSDLQNPTHQYVNGGAFTVTLTVTDNDGATGSTAQTVTVIGPSAAFTYTPISPTTQDPVHFFDQSTDPTGDIVSWSWDFGDGGASAIQNPIPHLFAAPGTYRVNLTITSDSGATVSTFRDITVQNALPIADFTFTPLQPKTGQMVTFNAGGSSDPDGQIVLYEWDFDSDGSYEIAGGAASTVTHAFNVNGQHLVTLRVTDNTGDWDTITQTVPVGINVPTAAFIFNPPNPKVNTAVTFDGSDSTDPDGTIVSYEWWVLDAVGAWVTGANGVSVSFSFGLAGPFQVWLRVTDNDGLTNATSQWVNVISAPPVANFAFAPANPKIGEVIAFNASDSNDPDGQIVSYDWDFDDDGVIGDIDATGIEVNHSFAVAGAHRVTLTVTDNDGNARAETQWIDVGKARPIATFIFTPTNPNAGQVVSFDASTSTDADGTIILYQWNFGDGTPVATGLVVTHSYAAPGVYPVTLTVTDNDTEFDVTTQGVPVEMGGTGGVNQPPVADFTFEPASPSEVNLKEVVTFKADGSSDPDGTINAYEWDFTNDGIYDATGPTVTHIFNTGGSKIVTLRVTDNEGARGFKTLVVSVEFIRPRADFTLAPTMPKVGEVVSFDGSDSTDDDGRIDFYEWDFDNNGVADATGKFVNHVFTTGGGKPVTLKVTDNDGVTAFITKTVPVEINTPPAASFTYVPENPTTADTIAFTSTSSDFDGTIIAWQWEFGDGETSDVQSPSHKYATAKTYSVKLTVTDNDGATSSVTENITVSEPANVSPVANFSFTPTAPQVNQAVRFNDLSTDADGTVTGWDWDFGDGGTSTDQNPTHQYTTVGIYTVALTVTDNEGAVSTKLEKQVTIGQAGAEIVTYSYPNPSSTQAHIVYSYPAGATDITLSIFSVTGASVFSEDLSTTSTEYLWDLRSNSGDSLPNGLYFSVITAKDASGKTIKSAIFKLLIAR